MYNELVNGAIIGMGGFLFADVLTMPGQVFSWWRIIIEKTAGTGLFSYWANMALLDCAKCVSGTICTASLIIDFPGVWPGMWRLVLAVYVGWYLSEK